LSEPPFSPTTLDEILMQPGIQSVLGAMAGKYGTLHLINACMLLEAGSVVPLAEAHDMLTEGGQAKAVLYDIMKGEVWHGEKVAEGAIYFVGKERHAVAHMVVQNDMLWRNPAPAAYRQ